MPSPDAGYPTELCPKCGKHQAIRGQECFVCFTGCVVDADGFLVPRLPGDESDADARQTGEELK